MSLRASLHSAILADADLTALIGAGATCKHYPLRAPQGTLPPYLVSQEIASSDFGTHGTSDDAEDTQDETLIQFTAIAETPAQSRAIIAALRAGLLAPDNAVLTAAHIVVTSPQGRELVDDETGTVAAQLDLTFFHNPNT